MTLREEIEKITGSKEMTTAILQAVEKVVPSDKELADLVRIAMVRIVKETKDWDMTKDVNTDALGKRLRSAMLKKIREGE